MDFQNLQSGNASWSISQPNAPHPPHARPPGKQLHRNPDEQTNKSLGDLFCRKETGCENLSVGGKKRFPKGAFRKNILYSETIQKTTK